jgi:tetratricopeptide (TPR) repeat protein
MRLLVFRALCIFSCSALVAAAIAAPTRPRGGDRFEDEPQPLVSEHPRTEEEQDRLDAAAKFAAGRTLEQREESAAALRLYERAARLDPQATPILRELVPLAYRLNRRAEALRYAVKLAEQEDSDSALPRRIGSYVAEQGELKRGAKLLEKALRIEEADSKPTAAQTQIRVELGRLYFLMAHYADAAPLFDKVLPALEKPKDFGLTADESRKLIGDDGLTYELIGATFLEVNRPQAASKAFEKLNEFAPNAAVLALNLARVDEKSNRPAEALKKLETYFDSHPAELSPASLEFLKTALGEVHQSDQFLPRLEKLHGALPESVALDFFLAEQYRQLGKLAEARPLYEAVLKKAPTAEAYRALVEVYRKTDQTEALLKMLGDVVEKSGSFEVLDKDAKGVTGDNRLAAKLYQIARDQLGKADKADATALRGAAALAAERKQFDVAEEFYNLALKADPKDNAEMLLSWGLELFLAQKDAAAAKVFQRGIDEGKLPDDKPAFEFYLAGALEMEGKTDEALAVVRKIIEQKKPKDARYAARLPWILFHAKCNEEAYKAYKELIARFDDDFSSEENRDTLREAREALSSVCVTLKNLPEAEEWLQQALDEFPDDVGAHNDLGYLWADEGKHLKRALAMIQQAIAAEPENIAYRDSLGWALFRLGRDDEAIEELKKATAGESPDATILEHLGDVYEHVHKSADALDTWNRALKGYEKDKDDERIKIVHEKIVKLQSAVQAQK